MFLISQDYLEINTIVFIIRVLFFNFLISGYDFIKQEQMQKITESLVEPSLCYPYTIV